jgi:hypothetical protein
MARPNSTMPKTTLKKIGNTKAASTKAAPHRLRCCDFRRSCCFLIVLLAVCLGLTVPIR